MEQKRKWQFSIFHVLVASTLTGVMLTLLVTELAYSGVMLGLLSIFGIIFWRTRSLSWRCVLVLCYTLTWILTATVGINNTSDAREAYLNSQKNYAEVSNEVPIESYILDNGRSPGPLVISMDESWINRSGIGMKAKYWYLWAGFFRIRLFRQVEFVLD